MKVRTSAFRRLAILSLSALAFAACDDKTTTPIVVVPPLVTITPGSANLTVGQTATFTANVQNDDPSGALTGVNFTSTNTGVATVNASGVVTAVAPGSTTIIATSKFNATKAASAIVTVAAPAPVTIAVAPSSAQLQVGGTLNLVATVGGTTNTAVTYSSSDATVATVSATGVVTATQKNGTAVITATSVADPTKTAVSIITVVGGNTPGSTQITITPPAATIEVGNSFTFVANVTGNTNTAKTFSSSDPTVATVNATTGVATALNKAGTTVISATSTADPTKVATATLTVTKPAVTIAANPTAVTLSPTQTQQVTPTLGGTATDIAAGVTCSSSNTAVATVTSPGCVITGVANGTAVITVTSVADPTKSAQVTVTVQALTQPSISIQSVQTVAAFPVNVGPGTTIAGAITVRMNVTAGQAANIQRVAVRLNGVEACNQPFNPPLAPTGGVAQIDCVVNTAQLDAAGAALFPNGVYTLTADAFSTGNVVVATATWGTLTLANTNTVAGTVTYDNLSVSDADNIPTPTPQIAAGVVWNGGSATVTVIPAIFTGTAAASLTITQDLGCDGATAGDASRTAAVVGGVASATFPETATTGAAAPGNDNVEDATVCYLVGGLTAANTTPITLPAGAGTGAVSSVGTAAGTVAAAAQAVDNVEPAFALAPAFSGAFTGTSNSYAGANTPFTTASGALINTLATDGGVSAPGGIPIAYTFYAVPAGTAVGTQTAMRTAVAAASPVTVASQLASSTVSNAAYILIERAVDGLGNTIYANVGTFGVDLEAPAITVGPGSMSSGGTNDASADIVVAVSDTFSGPLAAQFRGTVYSVLEVDSDAGTEVRCVTDAVGTVGPVGGSGVCPLVTLSPLTNIGGQTEIGTIVHPNAAVGNNEGYYVYEIIGLDRAGNASSTTLSFTQLNDLTAPGANTSIGGAAQPNTLGIITIDNTAGTVRLQGTIMENVDLRSYDTRFTYAGLAGTIPDQIPFVNPIPVDTYGLPLTGVVAFDQTSPVLVRDITEQSGANTMASNYGVFAEDIAGNNSFTFTGVAPVAGGGLVGSFQNGLATDFDASFVARADAAGAVNTFCLDRSGNGGGACPSATTVFAQVRVAPTAANPIGTVYFYQVRPGGDATFGTADDYNVLLGSTSSATVVTGLSDRTFTFALGISAAQFPNTTAANPDPYPVFAVAVAPGANGSGVMSDILTLNAQD